MAFVIDPAYLPATLTAPPMTDEEFAELCAEHPELDFEMSADGDLLVMAPVFTMTGVRNAELSAQLGNWADEGRRGLACGSSAGFVLPNGARRSADASWTLLSRVKGLPKEILERYWHLSPDFVVELQSEAQRPRVLRAKMEEWVSNGAQLGWLIDPETRSVLVYRPGREAEMLEGVMEIAGEGPVEGFVLDLRAIWEPLGA
jgi:Uma2 family endonuclease